MKTSAIAAGLWVVLWIPLSFVFQQNPHFAFFALLAPAIGPLSVFTSRGWQGNAFAEVTLPFLVFWNGLALAVLLGMALTRYRAKQGEPPNRSE